MTFSVFAQILLASSWKLLFAYNGSIEIERRDINYTNGDWTHQPDTFKIPPTLCPSDISLYCKAMGGHSIGKCKCECYSERTFGFYNGQWNCTPNSKVRQLEGCSLVLKDQTEDRLLITVPFSILYNYSYEMPTKHQRCYIIPFKSSYLLCDGSWKILNNNFVNERFSAEETDNTQFFTLRETTRNFWYNKVKGRILRMAIGCYNESNAIIRNCLLLKMQGTMTCPKFSLPPLLKPTTSRWTVPPTSSKGTSANELQTQSIRTPSIRSQSTAMESPSVVNKHKRNAAEENDDDNTGLIIGVVAGVIGLTLIVVAIVIVIKRRTKRNDAVAKSNTTVENVSYELGVDNSLKITNCNGQRSLDQDEYSYAYANAVPLGRRNMSNDPSNNQGPQISVSNHVYGRVQDLSKDGTPSHVSAAPIYNTSEGAVYAKVDKSRKEHPSNSDASIYNTIEEPEYAKVDKNQKTKLSAKNHDEPLYNVLEGPETDDSALEGRSDEPPCYQVLEGPFSEGAPCYDSPEQPPSNDNPVYTSLEGQNPSVYSTLNRADDTKRIVKQGRNYIDTVYDSVGDVINDTTDIYQKLNENGQNVEVYRRLSKGDSTLCMMNQLKLTSHSNA